MSTGEADWIDRLRETLRGEVRNDPVSLAVYSIDASIYEIAPLAICIPQDLEDLKQALLIAKRYQIPIIPRGAATGIAGGCIGKGLILDLAQYLNEILEIDPLHQWVICQPGVIQNQLNQALKPYFLRLGPDTSTGNRATLGGMLANNAAGSRSLRFGAMVDHILEVHLRLATGEELHFKPLSKEELDAKCNLTTREGEIYRTLLHLRQEHAEEIQKRYPPLSRRSSGYLLNTLLKPFPFSVAPLIAGSEGTLGVITKMKLSLSPLPAKTLLILLCFSSLEEALDSVTTLISLNPLALELLDEHILQAALYSPVLQEKIKMLQLKPCTMLFMEIDAEEGVLPQKVDHAIQYATTHTKALSLHVFAEKEEQEQIWKLRESSLGLLLSKRSYKRAIAFLEDLSIPPAHLSRFMKEFLTFLKQAGKEAGIYGHAGAGCMHIRPYVDLRDPQELETMQKLMQETAQLVVRFQGALSGEHGDGWIRSWLNPELFGSEIMSCFQKIKKAFDPEGRMNPGKILPTQTLTENLRLSPTTLTRSFKPFLDFSQEGGFPLSVDLCNGNGQCRKKEGLMCPSFQAYGNEWHSTRARAQALRAWIHEQLPNSPESLEGMLSVLEYCIECKGCKRECPSQVDMAKLKAEFLYQHQQKAGTPLRSYLFAYLGAIYRFASLAPRLNNWLMKRPLMHKLLSAVGITTSRPLPPIAEERFSRYCKAHPSKGAKSVVLCLDTYTEFLEPTIGIAAKTVLEALGFKVIIPSWKCCGRTFYSKGLLKQARSHMTAFLQHYTSYAQEGLTLLHLEPSCFSMIYDEMGTLCGEDEESKRVWKQIKAASKLLDHFLLDHFGKELPSWLDFSTQPQEINLHTHCHEKALLPKSATRELLLRCKGITLKEVDQGCCGLAGSFGYEKEHAAFSMQIGERALLPALRKEKPGQICIANGLSCRKQIRDGSQARSLHIIEWLAQQMKHL